jgi:hypothetical protein
MGIPFVGSIGRSIRRSGIPQAIASAALGELIDNAGTPVAIEKEELK